MIKRERGSGILDFRCSSYIVKYPEGGGSSPLMAIKENQLIILWNVVKHSKLEKVFRSNGIRNLKSFRFNIICGIPTREFSESRFRDNTVTKDLGSGRRRKHSMDGRKRIFKTRGARRDSNDSYVSTQIGRTRVSLG